MPALLTRLVNRLFTTEDDEPKFDLAFGKTILFLAIFDLFIVIPYFIGIALTMTLGPYLAGRIGGKHVCKKDGAIMGAMAGAIWGGVQVIFLISLMDMIAPVKIRELEVVIIFIIFFFNALFCAIGGWSGGQGVDFWIPKGSLKKGHK